MNTPENFWKSVRWTLGMLTIFLLIVAIKELKSIDFVGSNTNNTNVITVNGTGDQVTIPDIATFSFIVTETAKTVADAQAQATTKTKNAIKAMTDGGVADKDIQTTSYSINPHYEYQGIMCSTYSCPPTKSVLTGYEVSQSIQIKVRDLTKAGALFSAIGALGVQNINNLSFSVDKPESVQEAARSKAITDAQDKADKLAKQLGVSLVRITSFYESNNQPMYSAKFGMGIASPAVMDSAAAAPSIPVGEQKVTSNVTITYEIK